MDDLKSFEYVVYFYSKDWEADDRVDLDDVIEAGIKALGVEDKFAFVESEMKDSGHF